MDKKRREKKLVELLRKEYGLKMHPKTLGQLIKEITLKTKPNFQADYTLGKTLSFFLEDDKKVLRSDTRQYDLITSYIVAEYRFVEKLAEETQKLGGKLKPGRISKSLDFLRETSCVRIPGKTTSLLPRLQNGIFLKSFSDMTETANHLAKSRHYSKYSFYNWANLCKIEKVPKRKPNFAKPFTDKKPKKPTLIQRVHSHLLPYASILQSYDAKIIEEMDSNIFNIFELFSEMEKIAKSEHPPFRNHNFMSGCSELITNFIFFYHMLAEAYETCKPSMQSQLSKKLTSLALRLPDDKNENSFEIHCKTTVKDLRFAFHKQHGLQRVMLKQFISKYLNEKDVAFLYPIRQAGKLQDVDGIDTIVKKTIIAEFMKPYELSKTYWPTLESESNLQELTDMGVRWQKIWRYSKELERVPSEEYFNWLKQIYHSVICDCEPDKQEFEGIAMPNCKKNPIEKKEGWLSNFERLAYFKETDFFENMTKLVFGVGDKYSLEFNELQLQILNFFKENKNPLFFAYANRLVNFVKKTSCEDAKNMQRKLQVLNHIFKEYTEAEPLIKFSEQLVSRKKMSEQDVAYFKRVISYGQEVVDGVVPIGDGQSIGILVSKQVLEDKLACLKIQSEEYYPLERIGGGAWSEVYLIRKKGEHDPRSNKVLKIFKRNLHDNDAVAKLIERQGGEKKCLESMFKQEQKLNEKNSAMGLEDEDYPPLPTCFGKLDFELGVEKKQGLVYSYVHGETLESYFSEKKSIAEILDKFIKAAYALNYVHKKGVCHNDLKGDNFMIGKNGNVYLIDLGLGSLMDEEAENELITSVRGQRKATAPERIMGGKATPLADQYSFFCMLYETLAGQPPISYDLVGGDKQAFVYALKEGDIKPDRQLLEQGTKEKARIWAEDLASAKVPYAQTIACDVATTVMKGLRRKPSKRFTSMKTVMDCLEYHKEQLLEINRF